MCTCMWSNNKGYSNGVYKAPECKAKLHVTVIMGFLGKAFTLLLHQ